MSATKFLKIMVATMLAFANTYVFATTGDTSVASLNISGNVPAVFSVTARGLPGDLDLTSNSVVNDRLIGILHFKFNEDAASITVASSTTTGGPMNGAADYDWDTAFTVSIPATCESIDTATMADVTLTQAGVDYKSTRAGALAANGNTGIEEDCQLTASWGGTTNSVLPLAGVFSMTITVTMVAL